MEASFNCVTTCGENAFETRVDGCKQVSFGDRLSKIIIGTQVHSGAYVGLLSFRGEEDKRDSDGLCIGPKSGDDAVSVQTRLITSQRMRSGFCFFAKSTPARPLFIGPVLSPRIQAF